MDITILLTSTVIATLVSALINVLLAIDNNGRIKDLEKYKNNQAVITFRYTHLYDFWKSRYDSTEEVQIRLDLEDIEKELEQRSSKSLHSDTVQFHRIRPLLDEDIVQRLDNVEKEQIDIINKRLDSGEKSRCLIYIEASGAFQEAFDKSVLEQMERLLKLQ